MTSTLLDISRKIEPHKAKVLATVDRTCRMLGFPSIVVGAAVRDFILQFGSNIRPPRATYDIDFGVSVASWENYLQLLETLKKDDRYSSTEMQHRLQSPENVLIDILPFGAIEDSNRKIQWPHGGREMSMAGFSEAYTMAIDIIISSPPPGTIKIVSLAGLALLKILSWNDNPQERDRDAKDFCLIMFNYLEAQDIGYIYEKHGDLAGDDYELFSARILGRDLKLVAGSAMHSTLLKILKRECDSEGELSLVQSMRMTGFDKEKSIPRNIAMLKTVLQGVEDM
jgi:predicted nucleotidyltransferase